MRNIQTDIDERVEPKSKTNQQLLILVLAVFVMGGAYRLFFSGSSDQQTAEAPTQELAIGTTAGPAATKKPGLLAQFEKDPPRIFSVDPDTFFVEPELVEAAVNDYLELPPVYLVTINKEEQFANELAERDFQFLRAFGEGNASGMQEHANWFYANIGAPGVNETVNELAKAIDDVARTNGFGIATIDWVRNAANALRTLGREDLVVYLEYDLTKAIEVELEGQRQLELALQATVEPTQIVMPAPTTEFANVPEPTQASNNAQDPSARTGVEPQAQTNPTEFNPGIDPTLLNQAMMPGLSLDNLRTGWGMGYSRTQMLYTMKRFWAWTQGLKTPGLPETTCVVGYSEKPLLPPVMDATSTRVLGLKVTTVQLLLGEDCNIRPVASWNDWIKIEGPDRSMWSGYEEGRYWRSFELIWIGDTPFQVGQDLVDTPPLINLDGLFNK